MFRSCWATLLRLHERTLQHCFKQTAISSPSVTDTISIDTGYDLNEGLSVSTGFSALSAAWVLLDTSLYLTGPSSDAAVHDGIT